MSTHSFRVLGIPVVVAIGLFFALGLGMLGQAAVGDQILLILVVLGAIPLVYRMLKNIWGGLFGVDIIAVCAILGSLLLREYVAGAVILLMLSGGEALEEYALARAGRHLTTLLSRAPKFAYRKRGADVEKISASDVVPDDLLVVKMGDVVPVDGVIEEGVALLDESALTGEPLPVEKTRYMTLSSGSVSTGRVFTMRALRRSEESAYGRIVSLVRSAASSRPPMVRVADQYALFFNAITIVVALAAWFFFQDPGRALAVLVVASPCPLILAVPIAVMSAISAAARRGVVVKDGGALERLAGVKAFVFDKTGTVTFGVPEVTEILVEKGFVENVVLAYAAALEQLSGHVLASAIAGEAKWRSLAVVYPEQMEEVVGKGVIGRVEKKEVVVGSLQFLLSRKVKLGASMQARMLQAQEEGKMVVGVGIGGVLAGAVVLGDVVREEAKQVMADLRSQGVVHIALLTGDKRVTARRVGGALGIADVHAECVPEEKIRQIERIRAEYGTVAMVGDGINDAPALAMADVGIAMTSRGESAATDAADIVVTVDAIDRSRDVTLIARHMLRVARQGIYFGIGTSVVMMIFAALGYIPPVQGAILQEIVDIFVIINALRVLGVAQFHFGETPAKLRSS